MDKAGERERKEEEDFLALWLGSLKQLFPLTQCGCPGNRVVVARHREQAHHPESLAVKCAGGCHVALEPSLWISDGSSLLLPTHPKSYLLSLSALLIL